VTRPVSMVTSCGVPCRCGAHAHRLIPGPSEV